MSSGSKPHSLFYGTLRTVAATLLALQILLIAAMAHYVMLPIAKRSADDLAALLILSARTWVELPPQTRKDFELELIQKHQFMLFEDAPPASGTQHSAALSRPAGRRPVSASG